MYKSQLCIVDDHPLFREALKSLFISLEGFKVPLIASGVVEALEVNDAHQVDVALVDIHLADGNGFALTQKLKATNPTLKVILISALHEQLAAGWSLQFGADGMICKDAEPSMIIEVVEGALRGEPAFQPRAYRWLMNSIRGELSAGISALSPRELIVFFQIGQGRNSKEIGAELEISPRTVETYHRNIREKLCIPHHDALVQAATLFVGHGGGHKQIDEEAKLLSRFEACTLSKEEWTHDAHLIVAFLYLSRFSFNRALKMISNGIKRLNQSHGKPTAYHETITVAYARLIKSALSAQPLWLSALEFFEAHPLLLTGGEDYAILQTYYSEERLYSAEARAQWVEPDLKTLPS